MEDFRFVGHGPFWPHRCISCGSQKDLTDTGHEELVAGREGRVYVCTLCTRRLARANGLEAGPAQEEQQAAVHKLALAGQQITDMQERLDAIAAYRDTVQAENDSLREELAQRDGRIAQLETEIREEAQRQLALVGAAPDQHIVYGSTETEEESSGSEG